MQAGRRWRRIRIAIPVILLSMILARLVWMQLRSYPSATSPRAVISNEARLSEDDSACRAKRSTLNGLRLQGATAGPVERAYLALSSPGYAVIGLLGCNLDQPSEKVTVKLNQWLFVATVLMATLMTRFLTSSWTISLITAAMLLSRGRLLAEIGTASVDFPLMFCVTTWLAAVSHFIRTGAALSLAGAVIASLIAASFDRSMIALTLVVPVFLMVGILYRRQLARPVIRRLRGMNRKRREVYAKAGGMHVAEAPSVFGRFTGTVRWMLGMEFPPLELPTGPRLSYERGSLFRTIDVPFLLWIYWRKRWLRATIGWLAVFVLALLIFSTLPGADWAIPEAFAKALTQPLQGRVDLHFATSLAIIVVSAAQSPAAGLPSFLEGMWLALLALVLVLAASVMADAGDRLMLARLLSSGLRDPLLMALPPRAGGLWLEPVILSLGVAGIYNLMKVLDTRIAEKG